MSGRVRSSRRGFARDRAGCRLQCTELGPGPFVLAIGGHGARRREFGGDRIEQREQVIGPVRGVVDRGHERADPDRDLYEGGARAEHGRDSRVGARGVARERRVRAGARTDPEVELVRSARELEHDRVLEGVTEGARLRQRRRIGRGSRPAASRRPGRRRGTAGEVSSAACTAPPTRNAPARHPKPSVSSGSSSSSYQPTPGPTAAESAASSSADHGPSEKSRRSWCGRPGDDRGRHSAERPPHDHLGGGGREPSFGDLRASQSAVSGHGAW